MLTAGPLQDPSRIRPESASQSQKRLQKDYRKIRGINEGSVPHSGM